MAAGRPPTSEVLPSLPAILMCPPRSPTRMRPSGRKLKQKAPASPSTAASTLHSAILAGRAARVCPSHCGIGEYPSGAALPSSGVIVIAGGRGTERTDCAIGVRLKPDTTAASVIVANETLEIIGPYSTCPACQARPTCASVRSMARLIVVAFALAAQTVASVRNDLPQPYRTTRDWGELPAGVTWAAVTAVEPSPDGSIYVVHRCFANSCAGRSEAPILKYDANGKLLKSWGEGMFVFPHGATVDREGHLWLTDTRGENGEGDQVFKFSADGAVLMTLGKAGVSGSGPDLFDQPTDVVVSPVSGDIFVTDSHRNGKNNRVVKFAKDGTYIKEWGRKGSGRGEMSEP